MRLIVGLGNPGAEHSRTRHNAGFWFLDAFAESLGARLGVDGKLHAATAKVEFAGQQLFLLRPTTFMNRSGQSVSAALRYYKIEPSEMLVAHDELDLPAGVARLKFDGGHGGQNGLRSVTASFIASGLALAIPATRTKSPTGCSGVRDATTSTRFATRSRAACRSFRSRSALT